MKATWKKANSMSVAGNIQGKLAVVLGIKLRKWSKTNGKKLKHTTFNLKNSLAKFGTI